MSEVTMVFRLAEQINRTLSILRSDFYLISFTTSDNLRAKLDSNMCFYLRIFCVHTEKWNKELDDFVLNFFFADDINTELLEFSERKRRAQRRWPAPALNTSAHDHNWPSPALWLWSKSSLTLPGWFISHPGPLTSFPIGEISIRHSLKNFLCSTWISTA